MKCIHPEKTCAFRDSKGLCGFNPEKAGVKCPSDCPWLAKMMIGPIVLAADCLAHCVYELPDECPRKLSLISYAGSACKVSFSDVYLWYNCWP